MKKVLSFLCAICLMFGIISSCNKVQNSSMVNPIDTKVSNESLQISLINNDNDWKTIANSNQEIISKFVTADINLETFDFENEKSFLNVIGKSKAEYLLDVAQDKEAANRLILKYGLNAQPTQCISCTKSNTELYSTLRKILINFKKNKEAYTKFQSLISTDPTNNSAPVTIYLCCGPKFYASVTFCAISIEIFPVYLMCCALAYDTYCCH